MDQTPRHADLHRTAAGQLAYLMSVIRCGERLEPDEETLIRQTIQRLTPPAGVEAVGPNDDGELSVRYLGDLQRLTLKPGDTIVLTLAEPVSEEAAQRILAIVRQQLGAVPILILDQGTTLGVLGQ